MSEERYIREEERGGSQKYSKKQKLKMLRAVVIAVILGVVLADDVPLEGRSEFRDDLGQYALKYQTGSGIHFQEQGALKRSEDGSANILVQRGKYMYVSPEGVPVEVEYTADERGFVPVSKNIPLPVEPVEQ